MISTFLPKLIALSFFALAWNLLAAPTNAFAEGPTGRVAAIENKFPDELLFSIEASSTAADVRAVSIHMVVGTGPNERYDNVTITSARSVQATYTMKTGGNYFIAPGADITYWLRVEDAAGNRFDSPREVYWYADTRFQWRTLQDGVVTVYYYRNSEGLARDVLTAARETEEKVGGLLLTKGRPFRLMLYNTPQELVGAQRPETSETRRREILRVGVAYAGEDLVQVLGAGGTLGSQDTARHEIAHLFVHWAAGNNVPTWLNEGMAVWSQNDPGREYLGALERGIRNDTLLLLRGMDSFPGASEETIMAYGQAYSVVKYLVDTYGGDRLRAVFEAIRNGEGAGAGIQRVYGFNVDELEAEWRRSVGARPRASYESALPTPVSIGNIAPIDSVAPIPVPSTGGPSSGSGAAAGTGLPPFLMALAAVMAGLLVLVAGAAVFTFARRRG